MTAVTFPGTAELEPIVGEDDHATLDCSCQLVDVDDRVGIDQDKRPLVRRPELVGDPSPHVSTRATSLRISAGGEPSPICSGRMA